MVQLFYTALISVDLDQCEIVFPKAFDFWHGWYNHDDSKTGKNMSILTQLKSEMFKEIVCSICYFCLIKGCVYTVRGGYSSIF